MENSSVGIDVVSIERMGRAAKKELFLKRAFTGAEIDYSAGKKRPEKHLAGRFAAKEAFVKAVNKGILAGISLKDIEVVNASDGRPSLRLGAAAAQAAAGRTVCLSISYTREHAFAFVLVRKDEVENR